MNKLEKKFIPVMLTPFLSNGEVDYNGLKHLTEYYIEAGAGGLFANCLSSEMFELSEQERLNIVKETVDAAQGKVSVVATGTFGGPLQTQADFIKKVNDQGVEAVIGITGLVADESDSDQVFEENVFKLLDLTENISLGFYECPVPYKRIITPKTLGNIVSTGRITYHKDTCLDINQIKEKIDLTKDYNFGLYDAYMAHAVESLKAGSAGLSCIQGNFFPELVVWLCKNYNNTELETEVNQAQQFFIDNMDVMHNVYPTISKYCLQLRGFKIDTFTRRNDIGNFNLEIKDAVASLNKRYEILSEKLEIKASLV